MRRSRSSLGEESFRSRSRPKMDTTHVPLTDSENHQDQHGGASPNFEATASDAHTQKGRDDYSPLHLAVSAKDTHRFRALLPRTRDLNVRTRDGMTPLLTAARNSATGMTIDLLSAGADIHATDLTGMTALHWAAFNNCLDLVVALLPSKPSLNSRDSHGFTPLHLAQADIARCLLEAGANANIRDNEGFTPLHLAVLNLDTILFRILLYRTKSLDTRCAHEDMTPLTSAVKNAMANMVYNLIKAGADVNLASSKGKTPLHWAADFYSDIPHHEKAPASRTNIAKMLLRAGADANLRDLAGDTPMHVAANTRSWTVFHELLRHKGTNLHATGEKGKTVLMNLLSKHETNSAESLKAFESLLKAGASVHVKDIDQKTALHFASTFDRYDELNLLIKYGADVNAKDKTNMTPLHWVGLFRMFEGTDKVPNSDVDGYGHIPLDYDKTKTAISLLDAGANADAPDFDGSTPLYYAIIRKDVDVFRLLLDRVTDWKAQTPPSGFSPFLAAADLGMADMIFEMINAGVDINASTHNGSTALHYAASCAHVSKDLFEIMAAQKARAVRMLLNVGADPNAWDRFDGTALHAAVKSSAWPAVRELLRDGRASVNARDPRDSGKTLLMMVLERAAEAQLFRDLINAGASVSERDSKGRTALHYAVQFNKCEELSLLLQCGADVNAADEAGYTPVLLAAKLGLQNAYNLLQCADGVDVNLRRRSDGKTLLMLLLESSMPAYEFRCTAARVADIHATDAESKSAVHYAAEFDRVDELIALLERGGRVNDRDCQGRTPLYLAASQECYESCDILIRLCLADRDIADVRGKRPIDVAVERDLDEMVQLLNENMPAG